MTRIDPPLCPANVASVSPPPARMTSIKRPVLERMRNLLGVEPTVSLQDGVARVCARVRERLQAAGSAST